MSKHRRRTITIVITDTWTIRWGDAPVMVDAIATTQSQQIHIMNKENRMTAFENATKFFTACEAPEGWAGCQPYVAEGATFTAQSEPLVEVKTVQAYCEWMYGLATVTAPGATYDLHAAAYDEKTHTAIFFATYHAKHTGEGGPVPPTHKETHSHYVYFLTMNDENKVARMVKVWNAPWAMRELGWL
jgi:hypothetical protein